ncbi:SEC-C motif-containing protein/OTU-like cysteine protease family protein [Abeliophyllum distichum]|uniref:SEC-C motif-containing protein/OTU-like cysteine protease family protein n=1 Tax=Abeliophyllum distichum TaxID=126358 RepID=A0ABD1SIS8_9LAMI
MVCYPLSLLLFANGWPADHQDEDCEQNKLKIEDKACKQFSPCNDMEDVNEENNSQHDEKKIPRNKACPCGSKKKYKSCCGTVSAKSSARIAVNRPVEYGKSRKDRKQIRKGIVIIATDALCDLALGRGAWNNFLM